MPPIVEAFFLHLYIHQKLFIAGSAVAIVHCS